MTKINYLFILSCLISGISYNLLNAPKEYLRIPASQKALNSCRSAISSFHYGPKRAQRLKDLANARKENDFNLFSEILMNSHDNQEIKKGMNPNGFKEWRAWTIEHLQRRTNNDYVTSYFQHYEVKDMDTWGIFDYSTKLGENFDTEEAQLVLEKLMDWHAHYTNYRETLNISVIESFKSKLQYDFLISHLQTNKKMIKEFNFRNGNQYKIELPTIVKDEQSGEWIESTVERKFSSFPNLRNFRKDLKVEVDENFSDGLLDETFSESKMFKVIFDQAFYRRKLEFVRDRLNDLPLESLTAKQTEILEKFNIAIHRPDLMPRSDAIAYTQLKEYRAEWKSFFKNEKSRRKILNSFNARLLRKFGDEVKDKSQYLMFIKANLWGRAITSSVGIVAATAALVVTENDYVLYYLSTFTNWVNDILLENFGTTATLHECAIENREWTVENLCLHKFLFSHLSSHLYETRLDPDLNYLENEAYLKKRKELVKVFFKKRDSLGYGEFFTHGMNYVKTEGYKSYAATTFMELLDVQNRDLELGYNPAAKEDIYEYLTGSQENEQASRSKIMMKVGPKLMGLISDMKKKLPEFASKVEAFGGVEEDLSQFIEDSRNEFRGPRPE